MHYQISRNGQTYGPYTLDDLQRYVASGNVLLADLAKSEEMTEWVPVSQLLAPAANAAPPTEFASPGYAEVATTGQMYAQPGAPTGTPYPDAPNLHWGLVLLLGLLTCGLFMLVWNIVVSAWLRRVQPNATAIFYYGAVVALALIYMGFASVAMVQMMAHHGGRLGPFAAVRGLLGLIIWVVRLIARYSERASLEEHFNTVEPIGLRVNPVLTFFFGGIYFQSELNRINAMKQAARLGAGRGF